jgi:hypothetical protein
MELEEVQLTAPGGNPITLDKLSQGDQIIVNCSSLAETGRVVTVTKSENGDCCAGIIFRGHLETINLRGYYSSPGQGVREQNRAVYSKSSGIFDIYDSWLSQPREGAAV